MNFYTDDTPGWKMSPVRARDGGIDLLLAGFVAQLLN